MTIERKHIGTRMSKVVMTDTMVFLSGQTADADVRDQDITAQTKNVLDKIDGFLADAGIDKTHLLQAQIWVKDMADFQAMNAVWDAWVPEGQTPARACVQAEMASPSILVEIMVTAAR